MDPFHTHYCSSSAYFYNWVKKPFLITDIIKRTLLSNLCADFLQFYAVDSIISIGDPDAQTRIFNWCNIITVAEYHVSHNHMIQLSSALFFKTIINHYHFNHDLGIYEWIYVWYRVNGNNIHIKLLVRYLPNEKSSFRLP